MDNGSEAQTNYLAMYSRFAEAKSSALKEGQTLPGAEVDSIHSENATPRI